MAIELNLRFSDSAQVVVRFKNQETKALPFTNPLSEKDHTAIRWYVETYGTHSLNDPDDREAVRVRDQLPIWGKDLFNAVFSEHSARRLFDRFQAEEDATRLLTISAEQPEILALPWELLAVDGLHLFREKISIRRRFAQAEDGRQPLKIKTKDRLHVLFVVSRPENADFIDPRADAAAVLDAIDEHAPGRVTVEFLRPATLNALVERLDNEHLPLVDILHFDGHGVFDRDGAIAQQHKTAGSVESLSKEAAPEGTPHTGYLLFENSEGQRALVSARQLGENLHRRKVALVILSACQSAAQGGDDPFGSVAARLTATGIPAVLAMTHSVLVATTRVLFGEFYKQLVRGRSVGGALDLARAHLDRNPEKYEVQRGLERVPLKLHDWFLPALYQSGEDKPLLSQNPSPALPLSGEGVLSPPDKGGWGVNLPPRPEAGFFGRRRELWQIERYLVGQTRRVSVTGFGGQGKTALALEAGRWLVRTGLFDTAAFVNYAETPGRDAVAVAVAALSTVLGESLTDAAAATKALQRTACLVILDNLEILDAETLAELLTAAQAWSEAGRSRVLLTSRRPDFQHAAYKLHGTHRHRNISLSGLGSREFPDSALDWFAVLWKLPPEAVVPKPAREGLIELFDRVAFHPLSIRVLAAQLKTRRLAEVGRRLEQLLAEGAAGAGLDDEDHPATLVASLRLSLDRLDAAARAWLPRLGVFQGGAFEDDLLAITEIPEAEWPGLRRQLETAALIEPENLPGVTVPFLRFHPTLAPLLWLGLDDEMRERLGAAHRARYYGLAGALYHEDNRNPHAARAIARCELPNLLYAVRAALQRGEPEAVDFANSVNRFLDVFGLRREQAELTHLAERQAMDIGSAAWYLAQSNRGEQLRVAGQIGEAVRVFQTLLGALGEAASYWRAMTLGRLGRCFRAGGRPDLAAQVQQEALAVLDKLEPSDSVKRQTGVCWTDLADALVDLGQYPQARQAYLAGLAIAEEQNDTRGQGVTLGQLGALALREAQHEEAIQSYQKALNLFQTLQEPASEAIVWHQLGVVYRGVGQWEQAEHCYRESARLKIALGNLSGSNGAASTWNNLAMVNESMGKPAAAELWYRKAIDQRRADKDFSRLAMNLNNLANLLRTQPGRLAEARQLAEEALKLKQTLEPGAAEIWKSYGLLAEIAEQEAATAAQPAERQQAARDYRRKSREAYRVFPGNQVLLKQFAPLIFAACAGNAETLAEVQAAMREGSADWAKLADALDRLRAGERDAEALLDGLTYQTGLILETILQGIANPASLDWLRPDPTAPKD